MIVIFTISIINVLIIIVIAIIVIVVYIIIIIIINQPFDDMLGLDQLYSLIKYVINVFNYH